MKKFIVTLTALCAISTGSIAAETSSSIKSVSEVSKVTTQVFVPKASSTTGVQECTMWPQTPWDVRCPW